MRFSLALTICAVPSKAVLFLLLLLISVKSLLPLWYSVNVLCFVVCYSVSNTSFAIILMVALLCFTSWYLVIVVFLFLAIPRVFLQFVIVVFLDYTH